MKKTLREDILSPKRQFTGNRYHTIMFALLLAFLNVWQAQASDTVRKGESITIFIEDSSLEEALSFVEKKTPYHFFYNHKILEGSGKVNLDLTKVPIAVVVKELLKDTGLTYKIKGDQIVLRKRKKDAVATVSSSVSFATVAADDETTSSSKEPHGKFIKYELTVSGRVTSEDHEPLPGVNVVLKGTTTGTFTDADGRYVLSIPDNAVNGTLIFSFVGYRSIEESLAGRTTIDVILMPDVQTLDEIVVIGYGTQEKKDLTGAVSVVSTQDLQKRQATTVAEAIQGLATGVNIRGGGRPGSEARIEIRGLKNLSGNSNPLYVIDGLITTANRDFNPNDIESIQILKDASAAAIYGSRAANGVIIITTKKGKEGPMQVDISAKTGLQTIPRYDLMETEEFAKYN